MLEVSMTSPLACRGTLEVLSLICRCAAVLTPEKIACVKKLSLLTERTVLGRAPLSTGTVVLLC